MSCVNVIDNDTTLVPPTFTGSHPCVAAQIPTCHSGGYLKVASSSESLSFNPDGTWNTIALGGGFANCGTTTASPNGVIASGNWITGVFDPSAYEIRITGQQRYEYYTHPPVGGLSACPNPQNPIAYDPPYDTGWLSLSSMQTVASFFPGGLDCGQVCIDYVKAIKTFNVQIRQVSNPANSVSGSGDLCARINSSSDSCA